MLIKAKPVLRDFFKTIDSTVAEYQLCIVSSILFHMNLDRYFEVKDMVAKEMLSHIMRVLDKTEKPLDSIEWKTSIESVIQELSIQLQLVYHRFNNWKFDF